MSKPQFTIKDLFGNNTKYITYKLNGKTVIRRSSAPSKERINSDPAYHNVKMNNQEFAAATALSKAIRNPHIEPVYKDFKDTYMAGRLTGVCRKIIQQAAGELGKREACIATYGKPLINFPFNKQRPLGYSFNGNIQLQTTPIRSSISLNTTIATQWVTGQPKGATHAQLTLLAVTVSKHTFNNKTKTYQPKHPKQNALGQYSHSNPIPLSSTPTAVQLELILPVSEAFASTTAVIVAVGITFGTLENNEFIKLKVAKAMNIVDIL